MQPRPDEMVIGVDTHADTHTAVAINGIGQVQATIQIVSTPDGYEQLVAWARALDGSWERPVRKAPVPRDDEPLKRVAEAFAHSVAADGELAEAVHAARADGFSWAAIAAMLGVSKQTAQACYGA